MISLFRKIRQSLIAQSKITRYILYALGEILLVVIGILIALKVNNNNELNKLKAKERDQLIYVLENIRSDSLNIANTLESRQIKIKIHDELYAYIKGELGADQIGSIDRFRFNLPLQTATQKNNPNLANEVLSLDLKKQILRYYSALDDCEADIAMYNDAIETVLMPFLIDHELLNFSSLFKNENRAPDQINRELFFSELKKKPLQQVLFVSKLRLILTGSCELSGAVENENLKQAILNYLD